MKRYAKKVGGNMRSATRVLHARVATFVVPISADLDRRRFELTLNIIIAVSIFFSALFALFVSTVSTAVCIAFVIVFVGIFIASKCGHARCMSYLLVGVYSVVYIVGSLYGGLPWGDVSDPSTILFLFSVFVFISATSSVLFGSRFGLIVSGVLIAILILLDIHDIHSILYTSIIVFIAGIVWLSNHELEKSLRRACASEKELIHERDLLEIKVAERTAELEKSQADRLAELSRIAEFGRISHGLFHDLMTPLTSVALHVERAHSLMSKPVPYTNKNSSDTKIDCGLQETQAYIKKAITASEKMSCFMKNIRRHIQQDGSEIYGCNNETGEAKNAEETCDIGCEAAFVIELLAYTAREAGVSIESSIENGSLHYYPANPFYFYQIFQNLLSNAIEACAHQNKTVRLSISDKNSRKLITISDNGPGIAEKNMSKIFEPFFTTKQARHNTGIGLYTVKTIIEEKLKGKITVESIEGVGTTFTIELP